MQTFKTRFKARLVDKPCKWEINNGAKTLRTRSEYRYFKKYSETTFWF